MPASPPPRSTAFFPPPSPQASAAAAAASAAPAVQDAAWTLLEYLPLGGTTALLLRKAAAGAGVLELELTWPWAALEPTPDALPVHMESLILALQVKDGLDRGPRKRRAAAHLARLSTPRLAHPPRRSCTRHSTAGAPASSAAGPRGFTCS